MEEDPTENCTIDYWYLCQQQNCRWHGTCHHEAMLQPSPEEEEDFSKARP